MRHRVLVLGLLFAMLIATASECGVKKDDPGIDPQVYNGVLDRFYELIANGDENDDAEEGETGVLEAIASKESDEALDSVGYAIQDISGDGIPELLIGAITERDASFCYGSEIYAVYTSVKGEPSLSFEGRTRSGYRYIGKGKFFYQGSGGAMYSIFGTYTLLPNGKSLSCNDYYFTYEKDESFKEIGFYHNTSGKLDKASSKELKITDKEFWRIEAKLEKQVRNIKLIPFSKHEVSSEKAGAVAPQVRIRWAKDALAGFSAYDEFIADTSEAQVKIVFSTESGVKDFKVLAITLENVDENGKATFSTQELYALDALTPKRPLVVGMTFFGDLPSYGISYVDKSGTTRIYAVELSGEDGSLLLKEIG